MLTIIFRRFQPPRELPDAQPVHRERRFRRQPEPTSVRPGVRAARAVSPPAGLGVLLLLSE